MASSRCNASHLWNVAELQALDEPWNLKEAIESLDDRQVLGPQEHSHIPFLGFGEGAHTCCINDVVSTVGLDDFPI